MAAEHIYKQYDEDLEEIRANIIKMGAIIEEQIRDAVNALEDIDTKLAQRVIDRDDDINELETQIDSDCSLIIAKRAPQAKTLELSL